MPSEEQKLKSTLRNIEKTEEITEEETEWIKDDYRRYIKRNGAKKPGTHNNYIKQLKRIAKRLDYKLTEIDQLEEDELRKLNTEIIDNIQSSVYRIKKGENGKRRKTQQWTSWKAVLEINGWKTSGDRNYIPSFQFTENKDKVDRQADTEPSDLPSPEQMKEFLKSLGEVSGETAQLRNQALALLLWDKGPRIGEALSIQMKHVSVNGKQVKIKIPGNKKSDDRTVEIFQGRKTIRDYIESHPAKDDPKAYLFTRLKHKKYRRELDSHNIADKFKQARAHKSLDFKTAGEPCHIFRKANDTSHMVNEWATWEQLCSWKGKNVDGTKPDYVLMATQDVDASVAEKIGINDGVERRNNNPMLGDPLLPVNCTECSRENRCYLDTCQYCGTELPDSRMPDNLEQEKDDVLDEVSEEDLSEAFEKLEEFKEKGLF